MEEIELIVETDSKSPISEAYRAVRTNLQFASAGRDINCISFTSATPSEGKSTTISNVALAMAQDGKKVLLIDADMRKPVQHQIFGLFNKGLSNCIAMNMSLDEAIQPSDHPNLDILASGPVPPNPSELLGSQKMEELLQKVIQIYDYVLIDMPPVLAVTDAAVLSSKVDGVVFVIQSGKISPDEAKLAKSRLEQAGANILGAVLNAVPQRHSGYGYGYGYYYYYDEEGEKHKKKKQQ